MLTHNCSKYYVMYYYFPYHIKITKLAKYRVRIAQVLGISDLRNIEFWNIKSKAQTIVEIIKQRKNFLKKNLLNLDFLEIFARISHVN